MSENSGIQKKRKLNSILVTVLCAVALVFAIMLGRAYFYTSIVLSNSMEPTILTHAILVVQNVDFEEIAKDDIIMFNRGGVFICHRVVGVAEDYNGRKFVATQGDNNEAVDGTPVYAENFAGKVVYIGNWFAKGVGIFNGNKSVDSEDVDTEFVASLTNKIAGAGVILLILGAIGFNLAGDRVTPESENEEEESEPTEESIDTEE